MTTNSPSLDEIREASFMQACTELQSKQVACAEAIARFGEQIAHVHEQFESVNEVPLEKLKGVDRSFADVFKQIEDLHHDQEAKFHNLCEKHQKVLELSRDYAKEVQVAVNEIRLLAARVAKVENFCEQATMQQLLPGQPAENEAS